MRCAATVLLALAAASHAAAASLSATERIHAAINDPTQHGRHLQGGSHMLQLLTEAATPAERVRGVQTMWHEQTLDHFNAIVTDTFKQRFYVNSQFWNGTGPVFVYIGGEAALSPYSIAGGVIYDLASETGALLVALEHRYYGQSQPEAHLTPSGLQWLSSQQALADLSTWILALPALLNEPRIGALKKVTFGGSYPGALAAWSRLKYPDIIHAAWSSSGPVLAQEDFVGYMDVVAASLADEAVGGSPQCVAALEDAFTAIVDAVTSPDASTRAAVATQFCLCPDYSVAPRSLDTDNVISAITNNIAYAVQYDNQLPTPGLTIAGLCSTMGNTRGTAAVAAYNLWYMKTTFTQTGACPATCVNASYQALLDEQDVTSTAAERDGVGVRSWYYQTCTQFGYFQTCEAGSSCVFRGQGSADSVGLDYFTDVCVLDYAVSASNVSSRIDFTNAYYGGNTTVADRVVYVSGSVDPWHHLAVHHTLSPSSPAVFIPGMSHCQDLGSAKASDTPQLTQGRADAKNYIKQRLAEA